MAKSVGQVQTQAINLIGKNTQIIGDINSPGDIRIDGELTGNINCQGKLIIGHSGSIKGEVWCTSCEIAGTVIGNLHISDQLNLKNSSHIEGEIEVQKLSIEPGAKFTGSCSMGKAESNEISQPKEKKE